MMTQTTTLPWAQYRRLPAQAPLVELQALRPCPLSGSTRDIELLRIDDFQTYNDQDGRNRVTHRIAFNQDSGLLYTNPCFTPHGFAVLFDKAGQSYGHSPERTGEQLAWIRKHFGEVPHTLCDIGCGSGAFLKAMPDHVQKIGVDIDQASIDKGQASTPEISFYCQPFDSFRPDESIDLFTMFHVLEHLPNPFETLRNLRKIAKPEARMILEVPVLDRTIKEQGNDLVGFFGLQHLTHFSKATLINMANRAGWDVVLAEEMPGYNGFRILLQPGVPSEAMLTEEQKAADFAMAQAYLAHWRNSVQDVQVQVDTLPPDANVLVWGGGQHTEYLAQLTTLFSPNRRFIVVDSDPLKHGTLFHSIPLVSPDSISEADWRSGDFYVVASSYGCHEAIIEGLQKRKVPDERIVRLYSQIFRY